jgi:hypothetical protein
VTIVKAFNMVLGLFFLLLAATRAHRKDVPDKLVFTWVIMGTALVLY